MKRFPKGVRDTNATIQWKRILKYEKFYFNNRMQEKP